MTLYEETYVEEWPNPIPEGWVYAGTDDEFGVLDRWWVPVDGPVYRRVVTTNEEDAPEGWEYMVRTKVQEQDLYAWFVEIREGSTP